MLFRQRAHVAEDHDLRPTALADFPAQPEIQLHQRPHARLATTRHVYGGPHPIGMRADRAQEAFRDEVVLAAEIVAEASEVHADIAGDVVQGGAADALRVEAPSRRAEDQLALLLVTPARRARRNRARFTTVPDARFHPAGVSPRPPHDSAPSVLTET